MVSPLSGSRPLNFPPQENAVLPRPEEFQNCFSFGITIARHLTHTILLQAIFTPLLGLLLLPSRNIRVDRAELCLPYFVSSES